MIERFHSSLGFISRPVLGVVVAAVVAFAGGPLVVAQDATPEQFPQSESDVVIENAEGEEVGAAHVAEGDGIVTITIEAEGLEPGDHAVHIHNPGTCESEDGEVFRSTGGHEDPLHGPVHNAQGTPVGVTSSDGDVVPHAGDLGNITVADDGTGMFEFSSDQMSVYLGVEHALQDANGSALTIHELPDDLSVPPSDFPAGASGPHIACGVIHPPVDGTPVASPAATEEESGTTAEGARRST